MKIWIITFHCAYNYGSVLQAYALQTYLSHSGYDVRVIDYRSGDFDQYHLFRWKGIRSIISDIIFFPRNLKRKIHFESFITTKLNLTKKRYEGSNAVSELRLDSNRFDTLICGSDQIWNLDCTHGPVGPFFLNFASKGCKRIAYAPSLSHSVFEKQYFSSDIKKKISGYLNLFDVISVRELNIAQSFQSLTEKPIVETIDPTLLLSAEDYRVLEEKQLPGVLKPNKYVFAYTLWQNPEMNTYVSKLAREQKLTILYSAHRKIHYDAPARNCFGMSPATFLALIDNAKYIVSNPFHATVFSILFNKQFITYSKDQSTSRMSNLLEKFDMLDHLVDEHYQGKALPKAIDYTLVNDRLNELSRYSKEFLLSALSK